MDKTSSISNTAYLSRLIRDYNQPKWTLRSDDKLLLSVPWMVLMVVG